MPAKHVVTLVAGQGASLTPNLVEQVKRQTKALRSVWLSEGEAIDVFCEGHTIDELYETIKVSLADTPCDLFVQALEHRRKLLMVADMESTIIEQEMLDELASVIGVHDKVSDITRRAMNGELDFKAALCERVSLFAGRSEALLAQVAERITLMPGASSLLATMKAHKAHCWLVSGGFTYFSDPIAARLGFDRVYANHLLIETGVILGKVADPVLDKNAKKTFLEKACLEYGVSLSQSLAVGDGANDVPMLEASHRGQGLGIAYHAKPNVRAIIPHQVNHGDLTALLYAQGYHKSEFVA